MGGLRPKAERCAGRAHRLDGLHGQVLDDVLRHRRDVLPAHPVPVAGLLLRHAGRRRLQPPRVRLHRLPRLQSGCFQVLVIATWLRVLVPVGLWQNGCGGDFCILDVSNWRLQSVDNKTRSH